MTTRSLGETGIKLMGVYFGAITFLDIGRVAAAFALERIEGLPGARAVALTNALPVASLCVVAWICLSGGRAISTKLFTDDELNLNTLSRRDLLTVGLSLLGLSIALSGVPGLLQFAGKLLWYADGSRQAQFLPAMEKSWSSVVTNVVDFVVGWAVSGGAGKVASKLDGQFS